MSTGIRPATMEILAKLGDGTTGVEIGTHYGYNAIAMALVLRPKKLYCIDPWSNYVDPDSLEVIGEAQYLKAKDFLHKLKVVRDCVQIMRMQADDAVKSFADDSIDWVYIDGVHDFPHVVNDLQNWYPKVKKGGFVAGHDWDIPQVQTAVIAFSQTNNFRYTYAHEDWWIHK